MANEIRPHTCTVALIQTRSELKTRLGNDSLMLIYAGMKYRSGLHQSDAVTHLKKKSTTKYLHIYWI